MYPKQEPLSLSRTRRGHWSLCGEQSIDDDADNTYQEKEEQTARGEPVIILRPTQACICSAEDGVEYADEIHAETEVMQQPPEFLPDDRADIKTERHNEPDVKTDLPNAYPEVTIICGAKGDELLHYV